MGAIGKRDECNMIPKIIHYCWFGRGEYPEKVKLCMESWKKCLPDYEWKLWNEDSFDVNSAPFVKEAYESKKYAFVSDYVRVYALMTFGGIYLDTDIEVRKSFDDILSFRAVLGTDDGGFLTAFMASEPGHPYFAELLNHYQNMRFLLPDGSFNTEVNNTWMQDVLQKYGYRCQNEHQSLQEEIKIFPCEYFHAKSLTSGKMMDTKETYCVHHHTLLWVPFQTKLIRFLRMNVLVPILGEERYTRLAVKLRKNRW